MKQIPLASTGNSTSQLGFGCSSLMSATGKKESLALLEAAFAAGIRHFDVAPMYGYGAAETCLGEFLGRHPGQVTVTTKYGIAPPAKQGLVQLARGALRPVFGLFPGIKKRLAGAARTIGAPSTKAKFSPAEAGQALESSLRNLKVDRIDVWLLHEVEATDLTDDRLLNFLQSARNSGKIGSFGAGSSSDKIPALLAEKRPYCPLVQFEWSILDKPLHPTGVFTMHHRSLTANFAELRTALDSHQDVRKRWSNEIGADLAQPGMLASLMLKAALVSNPESVILVSSRNPAHIRENVRVGEDDHLADPARKLFHVAQREAAVLLSRYEPT